MSDEIWKRDEVQSPCVNICVVHRREKICTGCLRTLDEIATWGMMDDAARRAIMADLADRRSLLRKRRGGRAARLENPPD